MLLWDQEHDVDIDFLYKVFIKDQIKMQVNSL